ncbi:MAG: hypothetical protein Q8M16_02360 [Pirellulaceae bacterium]|nr:hypothetical protein [Pirellulaceae bacterium]
MTDPRVIEVLKFVLGIENSTPPVDLQLLGLPEPLQSEEQIRTVAKQALQKLESAQDRYSESDLKQAAAFIKQSARELLARSRSAPTDRQESVDQPAGSIPSPDKPAETPRPILVAKPVDPVRLVARVVTPVANSSEPSSLGMEAPAATEVQLVPSVSKKRKRGGSSAWLGWALLGCLLLLTSGAAGAAFLFLDEPWLTFQSTTPPIEDVRSDLQSNRTTLPIDKKPNDPTKDPPITVTPDRAPEPNESVPPVATSPQNQTPTSDPSITDSTPPVASETVPQTLPENESNSQTGEDIGPPDIVPSDPPMEADSANGQRVVILRHLELALIATAAGKSGMADVCWQKAKQVSDESRQCEAAVSLVEQWLSWRSEIYATAAARIPLLVNREELPVDDTIVSLISANKQGLVVRVAGQRREYEAQKLPWSLIRSILEVTNSDNPSEDQARKLVTDFLRRRETSDAAKRAAAIAWKNLLDSEFHSTAYPIESLQNLAAFIEANADWERLYPMSNAPQRMPVAEWSKIYRDAVNELKSNRDLKTKIQDKSISRFELEVLVWENVDANNILSIVGTILVIQQVALEQQDLTAFLDNLFQIEQLLTLTSDHHVWSDLGRSLTNSKPSDSALLQLLSQLRTVIDGARYGPQAIDGLSQVGKHLAQRLTDRVQRQEWLKKF